MNKFLLLSIVLCVGLVGCVQPQMGTTQSGHNPFTPGQVTLTLHKGVTTQAEVLNVFGSPNIVTQRSNGGSVWTYQKNATVSRSTHASVGGGLLNLGTITLGGAGVNAGVSGFEQSSRTMTLIISFNRAKKVIRFKSLATNF